MNDPDAAGLHPRPTLRRPGWTDLCGPWGFAFDEADAGIGARWFDRDNVFDREIIVPFPPESPASGIGETGFHPVVWYRREIVVEDAERTGRLLLHFGAVDHDAQVWINGRLAIAHEGGSAPFAVDIVPLLVPGAKQVVTVRAFDDPHDLTRPRGKQYWEAQPAWIWYHRTTGIWQTVWLEPLPAIGIDELRWTPDLDQEGVGLTLRLSKRAAQPMRVRIRLSHGGKTLADQSCELRGSELRCMILLDADVVMRNQHRLLWNPHHPNLIDAQIELLDDTGAVIDAVHSYFGLRSIEVSHGQFLLNGVPTFMRLVLAQNYWPQSHLAAPDDDALRREVVLARALGFNGVRIHQKIEDPRFLYWCDRLGLLVWVEAANAYVYDDRSAERTTRAWLDRVRRDYNHPCIVTWVPMNESWGVSNLARSEPQQAFVRALYHLTRALDPTRPVVGNDGWQNVIGEVLGIHDYALDPAKLRERYGTREALAHTFDNIRPSHHGLLAGGNRFDGQAVVISEFGGLSFAPQDHDEWFGYGTVADVDELLERYRDLVLSLLSSTALAGFCYTQLTDTAQETNGLLTVDRQPKLPLDAVRAINQQHSMAVPSEVLDALFLEQISRRDTASTSAP